MTQKTITADEVLNTIGYEGFVKALYNRTGDLSKDATHAILGIVTECREYLTATDEVNAVEEAGDLTFYVTALKQVLDDFSPTNKDEFGGYFDAATARYTALGSVPLVDVYCEWLDLAKRWVGYGKAPTMPTTQLLAEASVLMSLVINSGRAADADMHTVLKANVEKLLERYKGLQFNAERAVHRDLPAERAVLEASAAV